MTAVPKPPKHLTAETRSWWLEVAAGFDLEAHHLKLLTLAGEAWDRTQQARRQLERDGPYFKTRFGEPRSHPALAVERDSRIAFARLLRELALDVSAPGESRPPAIGK